MDVIASDGQKIGQVDQHVHLNKVAKDVRAQWSEGA